MKHALAITAMLWPSVGTAAMEQKAREVLGVWVNLMIEFVFVQNVGCPFFRSFPFSEDPHLILVRCVVKHWEDISQSITYSRWFPFHLIFSYIHYVFVLYPPFTRCPSNNTCQKHPSQINDFVTWLREKHSTKIEATKDDGGNEVSMRWQVLKGLKFNCLVLHLP